MGIPGSGGKGQYDPTPMSCGDCDFETHYENELFDHLKMHLRKEANLPDDDETEVSDFSFSTVQFIQKMAIVKLSLSLNL